MWETSAKSYPYYTQIVFVMIANGSPAMGYSHSGFSLIESLICLVVLVVLIMGVANPSFSSNRERVLAQELMSDIMSGLSMTRSHAIAEAVTVTFCRSRDGQKCLGNWNEGAIIFTDHNEDHVLNGQDRLIFRLPAHAANGKLSFNSFQNRQYLQIDSRGFTKHQNGNFTFCSADADPAKHLQIILSLSGRTRYARDKDGDGLLENSQGKPLKCKR